MAKYNDCTLVVFRKFNDGEIIALFPNMPCTRFLCGSYMHIGQHDGADYNGVIQMTKPATPTEYNPLLSELVAIGYDDLRIMQKRPVGCPTYFPGLPY